MESTSTDAAGYRSVGFYSDKLGHPAFATSYDAGTHPSGSDTETRGVGFFVNTNTIGITNTSLTSSIVMKVHHVSVRINASHHSGALVEDGIFTMKSS